jgi:hypothetical protein
MTELVIDMSGISEWLSVDIAARPFEDLMDKTVKYVCTRVRLCRATSSLCESGVFKEYFLESVEGIITHRNSLFKLL